MLILNKNILTIGGNRLEGGPLTPPTPPTPVDPYNPLGLPANTIRIKFSSGYTPSMGDSRTLVDDNDNVWDIYKQSNDWNSMFYGNTNLLEVLGANTSNITHMPFMFRNCSSLTNVALFDTSNVTIIYNMFRNCSSITTSPLFNTSNVTDMSNMFDSCTSLTTVPLFDTSKVTNMQGMFNGCRNVQSGALALYQQASSQANPPSYHGDTFYNCGSNTQTGYEELNQIPYDWGGYGA